MNKQIIAIGGILGILVLMGWLLWPDGDQRIGIPAAKTGQAEAPSEPALTEIDEPIQENVKKAVLPPAKSLDDEEESSSEPTPLGPDEGYLEILVLDRDSGKPVQGAELTLDPDSSYRDREESDRFYGALEAQKWIVKTESDYSWDVNSYSNQTGKASVRLPAGIPFQLHVWGEDFVMFSQDLGAMLPGEQRKIILEVFQLFFYGKVVEKGSGGNPILGASISYVSSMWEKENYLVTDAQGRFFVPAKPECNSYISIRAAGYGPAMVFLTPGHESPETALTITLDRAASLYGQVKGPTGTARGALVYLTLESHLISQGEEPVYGEDPVWEGETDGFGSYRIEGLPSGVELKVEIALDNKPAVTMRETLVLEPGEEHRKDWGLGHLSTIRGKVVDQEGRPVSLVRVIADADRSSNEDALLRRQVNFVYLGCNSRGRQQVTDEKGAFEFTNIPAGWVLIGVSPISIDQYPPSDRSWAKANLDKVSDVSPTGMWVQVPDGPRVKEILLKVYRGLYIRGRVEGPEGELADGASIYVSGSFAGDLNTYAEENGSFVLGPLLPGKYTISASGYRSNSLYAQSEPVEIDAGVKDVVLVLTLGGIISGWIIGSAGLDLQDVSITAEHREKMDYFGTGAKTDGLFRMTSLKPGLYDLIAWLDESWVGCYIGARVVAGSETKDLLIQLQPTAMLVVKMNGDMNFCRCLIEYQGITVQSNYVEPGVPCTIAVPPGRLRVMLRERRDEETFEEIILDSKLVDIKPGEEKEITFDLKE